MTERGNKEKRKPEVPEESRNPPPDGRPANGASLHISDEERLKIVDAVIENMNEGLFLIDEDFKYVMINPASGRILSHDPKQWIGKRAGNYVHPDDRVKSHETVMRTIQGENSSCEVRIMGSDGKYRHLEMHYSLIVVGETFYVLGLVEDITERKAIESELRASEEKYRTLVETQSVAIMTLDLRGSILFANDNFQNVFGYSVNEAHNYNLFNLIHPDEVDRAHKQISQASRGKRIHNMEYRMMTKCGAYVPILMSASPVVDKNGKVVTIICTANDITDLKASEGELKKYRDHLEELVEKRTFKLKVEMSEREKANEALKVTKERLEYVLGVTKTGFDIVDEEYNVVYVDPAWEKILGDYRGKKCYDYFMGAKQPCETCGIPKALKDRAPIIAEEYLKKEDRYVQVHTIPFKTEEGTWLVAEFNVDITERKKAERELRESEEKYRALFNQASDGIMFMAVDGSSLMVNESFARMHGYGSPAEMERMGLGDLDTPETAKLAPERLRRMIDGETLNFEVEHRHKDGRIIILGVHCSLIKIGEKSFFLGFHQDITSRKNAESALIESEKKFRELADNSPNMIFINRMGNVVYANKKCSEMMGYAPEEFLADGFDFITLVAPEDRKRVTENARKRLDGMESAPYEYTLMTKDHRRFEVLINSKPIRYEGQPAILGIITDVSQLKRVKVDLAEMEDFQRNILKMMPEAVVVSDLTGKITFVSEKALELGRVKSMKDVEGMSFFELIAPEDHERAFDDMAKLLKSESHLVTQYRCVRMDGSAYDAEVSSALLKSATGKVRAIMGIVRDVTDRNKIESALLESEEKYRHLVEMAQVGIAIIQNGKVAFFNEKALGMMNYTKDMAGRVDFLEALADEQRGRVAELYTRRMRGEEIPSIYETVLKRSDGSKFPAEITASIITYLGKPADMVIIRDLSDIAKAGEALQRMSDQLRSISENMADGMVYQIDSGADGTKREMTYLSPAVERLHGLSVEEVLNDPSRLYGQVHEEDREALAEAETCAYETRTKMDKQVRVRLPSGEVRWRHFVSVPRKLDNGHTVWDGIELDVTERIQSESVKSQSEARFRELAEGMFSGLAVYEAVDGGEDFVFVDFNKAAEKIEKLRRADVIGKRVTDVFPGVQDMGIMEVFRRVWKTGKSEHFPMTQYKDDRKSGWRNNYIYKLPSGEVAAIYEDVTEQRMLYESVRESEEKFRLLIQNAHDAIFVADAQTGVLIEVNKGAEELTGRPRSELIGMHQSKLHPPQEIERYVEIFKKHLKDGRAITGDVYVLRKDGESVPVSISSTVFTLNGRIVNQGTFRDMRPWMDMEKGIRESESKYRTLFDMAHDAIFLMDGNIFIDCNLKTLEMFQYTREQIIGQPPYKFSPETQPDGERSDEKAKRLIKAAYAGESQFFEWTHTHMDGSLFDTEVSLNRVMFKGKEYLLAIVRDITERIRATRDLAASESKLHTILNSMDDLVFGFDAEGRFNFYHAPKGGPLYAPPEAFVGKHFKDILPPPVAKMTSKAFELAKKGEVSEFEYSLEIGGSTHWFIAKVSPTMEGGHYRGAVAVVRDITERKASEEAIRGSEERLKALFHASIDGIGVECRGKYAYANPSFALMHGYADTSELVGVKVAETIAPEDRKRMAAYSVSREVGEHAPNRYQYKALRKDGTTFDAEISISEYMLGHELFIVGFVKDVTEQKRRQSDEVQRQILEAQFKLKSVITDIVPVMLGSMSKEGRADLVEKLSERLDSVLLDKYPKEMAPHTPQEVAGAYIGVLADLGGKSVMSCPDEEECKKNKVACPDECSVTISVCPWDNRKARNILLCVLCRGIAWRFASRSKKSIDVQLVKSMADGEKRCLIELKEEKD